MQLFGGGAPNKGAHALAGLANALGVASTALQDAGQQQVKNDKEQAKADAALGKVDPEKVDRSAAYEQGVYEASVLEQYRQAEAAVIQRAADELDHSLPVDQQVHTVDAWMKEELADLSSDAKARRLIAERYQPFIERFAGEVTAQQTQARASAALETTRTDVYGQIAATGGFDYSDSHQRLKAILGDGGKATEAIVAMVGQRMVEVAGEGGDYAALESLLPQSITTQQGKSLPGPLASPKNRAILDGALEDARRAYAGFIGPESARADAEYRMSLDAMLRDGRLIGPMDVQKNGPDGKPILSPAAQADYIDRSYRAVEAAQTKAAEEADFANAISIGGSWLGAIGLPGGPKSKEDVQAWANGAFQRYLDSYGKGPELHGGPELVKHADALNGVLAISGMERVAHEPLAQYLRSVTNAAPGNIGERLSAYQSLKARGDGMVGLYLDDTSHALYERALSIAQTGADGNAIVEALRRPPDADTTAYVVQSLGKIKPRQRAFSLPAYGAFRDVESTGLENRAYVEGRIESLTREGLNNQLSPEAALTFAQERFRETHTVLRIGDKPYAFPSSEIPDPKEATDALAWWNTAAQGFAKRHGVPEPELVTVRPGVNINGRALEFTLVDELGVPLPGSRTFSLAAAIRAFRTAVPKPDVRATVEAAHAERQRKEQEARDAMRDYKPPMQMRMQ